MKLNNLIPSRVTLALLAILPWFHGFGAERNKIETPSYQFSVSETDGKCRLLDKRSGMVWTQPETQARFGQATVWLEGKQQQVDLRRCVLEPGENAFVAVFSPIPEKPSATVRISFRNSPDKKSLQVACASSPELKVESLSPMENLFAATSAGKGYVLIPAREGLLIPADSGLAFTHRFDTSAYEGCHMQMLGVVEQGSAALLTWLDPYVVAEVKSTAPGSSAELQRVTTALTLRKTAKYFEVRLLGKGDHVTVAKAYREVARNRGLLVTWKEKLKTNPERAKLFGAINYKLWSTLDRRMNEESTQEISSKVNWTFEEAAQIAEHLKNDLKLDRVLFMIGGWIHRGYDNQHPDILPTAPECGGDAAFSDCARRVMDLGYVFSLHDNYQDIYRDSPSWDERFVMKNAEGKLTRGGHWAGGLAYLTCSQMALELAKRPQNLAAVKKLSNANSYFIDTTYASGLQECFDPAHPLTRADDMKWKQALSDYSRDVFGIFGSECGREWAIPHSDFFEGITGVSGRPYHDTNLVHKLGARVVPLFELVYHDAIAAYGKYGYSPQRAGHYVLQHISLGRTLNYHSIPAHLYWKQTPPAENAAGGAGLFVRSNAGWAEGLHPMDRFVKNTYEVLSPLNEITSEMEMTSHQFLTADGSVEKTAFGHGSGAVTTVINSGNKDFTVTSKFGGKAVLPPYGFLVESPRFLTAHVREWNGVTYPDSVMFTLRSMDKKPLMASRKVRLFNAFGQTERVLKKNADAVQQDSRR